MSIKKFENKKVQLTVLITTKKKKGGQCIVRVE